MLSTPGIKYNTERQKHPSSSGCTTVEGNCANSNDVEEAFDVILFSEIQRSNFILSAFFPIVHTTQHTLEQLKATVTRLTGIDGLYPLKPQRLVDAEVTCERKNKERLGSHRKLSRRKKKEKRSVASVSRCCLSSPVQVYGIHFLFWSQVKQK